VMEITGENPKRLSTRGFHPSWSPDGKRIVAAASGFVNPSRVAARAAPLLILDAVEGGETALTHPRLGMQPVWSPHGHRIAFWTLPDDTGRRDVLTVSADGNSPPVAVTHDEALDWNPAWSPDGRQLYFISDRGGAMNLWRVAIDEKTGVLQGAPEPVTVPSLYTKHASMAANGETFAFVRAEQYVALFTMNLDPATLRLTSQPERVGDATTSVAGFNLSPDETRIAFDNLGDPQEDLWIMNIDGTGRRRLTNDLAKDRDPSWSPDGKLLVFYSDRDGKNYNIWSIATDGSGLRRRTDVADRVFAMSPIFTHDGSRILYFPWTRPPSWLPADGPVHKGIPLVLPGFDNMGDIYLQPFNPSKPSEADHFLGDERTSTGRELIRYQLSTARAERLGAKGTSPAWLPGQKRFLFARGGRLMHYDLATKGERELLSVFPNDIWNLHVTRDGRRVYFTSTVREGDIWLGRFRR
jgi:Tol biopolymer transport system component